MKEQATFANRLRELRKQKELTQTDLGKLLNLSKQTISVYENGGADPNPETLNKLADFFGVSVDYLLGRTDDPRTPEQKIETAISDDPELMAFWKDLTQRQDLQLLFKQVRPLSPAAIKKIIKVIKAIEDEEDAVE